MVIDLMKKLVFIAMLLIGTSIFLVGCEQEGPLERAGENVEDAVEDAGDRVEDAGDKVEKSTD